MVLPKDIKQEKEDDFDQSSGGNPLPDHYMPSRSGVVVKVERDVIAGTDFYLETDVEIKSEIETEYNYPSYSELDFSIFQDVNRDISRDATAIDDFCIHRCQFCHATFFDSKSLIQHKLEHIELKLTPIDRTNQCKICFKYFIDLKTLKWHIAAHEMTINDKDLMTENRKITMMYHQCKICGSVHNYKNWHTHISEVHSNKKYVCDLCNREFKCRRYIRNHMENKHLRRSFNVSSGREDHFETVKCHLCPVVLRKWALTTHLRNCHSTEKAQCHICKSVLKCKSYLYAHMKRVHYDDGKEHVCECGKSFKSPRYLRVHIKNAHSGVETIGKTTRERKQCEWKKYDSQKRVFCDCGRSYSGKSPLIVHIKKAHMS